MSQKEFFSLNLEARIRTLYREGTFIVAIRYYGYKINLYLLSNFYIEVFYNHKFDKIERMELLRRKNKRIKFYADQISLPSNLL
ncbi:MAG: hypothetical protein HC819_07615 [Cyclobacteriaceae bacterium]|nr:hypothetical protein [Cyclobacteriaceae bacterium]